MTEPGLTNRKVVIKLNQQQLELIDRTITRGVAPDRVGLIKLALAEYASRHLVQGDAK